MSTDLTTDHLKTLDQMRQRLSQLSTSIQTLHAELERAQPVPTWPSLQSSAQLLSYNMRQLGDLLASHQPFLRTAHAYPLTSFPGHTHPFILETLLSKKLSPRADEWIDDFSAKYDANDTSSSQIESAGGLSKDDLSELWNWAGPAESEIARKMLEDSDEEEDDVDEEDEGEGEGPDNNKNGKDGDAMETDQPDKGKAAAVMPPGFDTSRPALPLEHVLRFISTGDIHSHVTPYRR